MLFFHNVLLFFLHNVELLCWQKAVSSSSSWWRWWQTFDKCFTPIFLQILGFKKSFVSAVYKLFQDYESFDKSFYLHILFIYQTRESYYRAEFWYRNIIKKILIKETSKSFLNVTSHAEELFGEIKIPLESAKMNKSFIIENANAIISFALTFTRKIFGMFCKLLKITYSVFLFMLYGINLILVTKFHPCIFWHTLFCIIVLFRSAVLY